MQQVLGEQIIDKGQSGPQGDAEQQPAGQDQAEHQLFQDHQRRQQLQLPHGAGMAQQVVLQPQHDRVERGDGQQAERQQGGQDVELEHDRQVTKEHRCRLPQPLQPQDHGGTRKDQDAGFHRAGAGRGQDQHQRDHQGGQRQDVDEVDIPAHRGTQAQANEHRVSGDAQQRQPDRCPRPVRAGPVMAAGQYIAGGQVQQS